MDSYKMADRPVRHGKDAESSSLLHCAAAEQHPSHQTTNGLRVRTLDEPEPASRRINDSYVGICCTNKFSNGLPRPQGACDSFTSRPKSPDSVSEIRLQDIS
jgi:hypothetical protein